MAIRQRHVRRWYGGDALERAAHPTGRPWYRATGMTALVAGGVWTEREAFRFRCLGVFVVALASLLSGGSGRPWLLVLAALGYLAYAWLLRRRVPGHKNIPLVCALAVVDALFLGLVVSQSGQAGALLFILLPLAVVFYAGYGAYVTSFFAATVMLMAYAVSQWLAGYGMPSPALMAQAPLFYLLAAFSGYLALGRVRRQEEQEALQRLLRLENGANNLHGIVRAIQEASDLDALLQDMAEAAPRLIGLPECLIAVFDKKTGALVTRAATTPRHLLGVDELSAVVEWPTDGSLVLEALTVRAPVAVRQPGSGVPTLPQWAVRLGQQAVLAVPLTARGIDVGMMFCYGVPAGYAFSEREVTVAQTYADVVALMAANGQIYDEVRSTVGSVLSDLQPAMVPKETPRVPRLTVLEVADLTIDLRRRQARLRGQTINLTQTEFDLLAALAESPGRAVDQETLLRKVWGQDYRGRSTVVDVGVHRLRRKIEDGPGTPRRIVTVRGSGYMLVPGVSVSREGQTA